MHTSVLLFILENVRRGEFEGKRVLEVGSLIVNGGVRDFIERFLGPKEYIGIDIQSGPGVDIVVSIEEAIELFPLDYFDVIISTETLEHIQDWRTAINNMKKLLKPGGIIYLTTRSRGFKFHAYPHDFWRFEVEDMRRIFSDFMILKLERDWEAPGVFLKARKPEVWRPTDLSDIELYCILTGRREKHVPKSIPPTRKIRFKMSSLAKKLGRSVIEVR